MKKAAGVFLLMMSFAVIGWAEEAPQGEYVWSEPAEESAAVPAVEERIVPRDDEAGFKVTPVV